MSEQISVVIPAYNAARYVREAVESVLSQDGVELDLIVVDDGSTDGTAGIVDAVHDPRVSLIRQENRGVSAARNAGAARAGHGLLVFLDADDILLPGALARYARAMVESPECVVAYGESARRFPDRKDSYVYRDTVFGIRPSGYVLENLLQRNFLYMGASCVRTRANRQAGGFRADVDFAEDWEYWIRLALLGPFQYISTPPVLIRRIRSSSMCRSLGTRPAAQTRAVRAIFNNPEILERVGARGLRRVRRRFIAHVTVFCADQSFWFNRWADARSHLVRALSMHPQRPREWILLVAAIARHLPAPIRKRLW